MSEIGVSGAPRAEAYGVSVVGVGTYVPHRVVTNEEVSRLTGVPAARILEQTGIRERRIVAEGETPSSISVHAARQALAHAGISAQDVGLVVGCRYAADYLFPAMACKVADSIGASQAGAFDVVGNCTGFQIGLSIASDRLRSDPSIRTALVLGTAVQSPFLDRRDPESMYFGDGAGAAVLGRVPAGYGVLATELYTNGSAYESVRLRGGGAAFPIRRENVDEGLQFYEMKGLDVWKQVVLHQPRVVRRALEKIGATVEDVDFFIFHQANLRLIEYLMSKMHKPMNQTFTNVAELGNTADASLAIALAGAVQAGCLHRDDLLVVSGVGAGFTFGATVIRWY